MNGLKMSKFSLDIVKDSKLFGKLFTLKGIGENGVDLKGKLVDIDKEGYYIFRITTHNTDYEEYMTRNPNSEEIV